MPKLRLYHGTTCEKAESIRRNGLRTTTANVMMPARWWTLSSDRASAIDHSDGCLVEFALTVPSSKRWAGYPYLWPAHEVDWCDDGKMSNWYSVRKQLPASAVKSVTRVTRPGCKRTVRG